jgi:hypothetical protein
MYTVAAPRRYARILHLHRTLPRADRIGGSSCPVAKVGEEAAGAGDIEYRPRSGALTARSTPFSLASDVDPSASCTVLPLGCVDAGPGSTAIVTSTRSSPVRCARAPPPWRHRGIVARLDVDEHAAPRCAHKQNATSSTACVWMRSDLRGAFSFASSPPQTTK